MILVPKRKLIIADENEGGMTINNIYHHLQDSIIDQFSTGPTQVIDRLHVRHRLRIPVGTDMFDA